MSQLQAQPHIPIWTGVIEGEACSKANSRQQVPRRSKKGKRYIASIKSDKALAFAEKAIRELKIFNRYLKPLDCKLIMEARFYYKTERPDLDDSLVCDVLQKAGVIVNDRQIREKHLYHAIDKENPRVVIQLSRVDGNAVKAVA